MNILYLCQHFLSMYIQTYSQAYINGVGLFLYHSRCPLCWSVKTFSPCYFILTWYKMLLYQNGDIKIKSAKNSNHLTLSNETSWILLNFSEFHLWLNFISDNSDYERAVLHKPNGQIEILNICGNFMLIFSSGRGFFTKVLVRKE